MQSTIARQTDGVAAGCRVQDTSSSFLLPPAPTVTAPATVDAGFRQHMASAAKGGQTVTSRAEAAVQLSASAPAATKTTATSVSVPLATHPQPGILSTQQPSKASSLDSRMRPPANHRDCDPAPAHALLAPAAWTHQARLS